MINNVSFNGRLTDDPELRYTQNGTAVVNFTIAIQRSRKNKSGDYETDFIDCVAFRGKAEWIAQNIEKGEMVGISGRIQTRLYEVDGSQRKATEAIVNDFQKLEWDNYDHDNSDQEEEEIEVPF